jgi:hypothetical protein
MWPSVSGMLFGTPFNRCATIRLLVRVIIRAAGKRDVKSIIERES